MGKKKSFFDGESYKGYRVSIRLVREGLEEFEPFNVRSPDDVYRFMGDLKHSDRERCYSLFLDVSSAVVGCEEVSCGTAVQSLVSPREVFKAALLCSAHGIIFVHNHTSGRPEPSKPDFDLTELLYHSSRIMGIEFLDSIIIGHDSYYSFVKEGAIDRYGIKKGKV